MRRQLFVTMTSMPEIKIDKLTSENYFKWKGELKCALVLRGLWDAVEENAQYSALEPPAQSTMNQKAFSAIYMAIQSDLRAHVSEAETAKQAYDKIAALFRKKAQGTKRYLRRELEDMKCGRNEDVLAYVGRAQTKRLHLFEACGEKIEDSAFIDILIAGLGAEFDSHMDYRPASMKYDDFLRDLHTAASLSRSRNDEAAEAFAINDGRRDSYKKRPEAHRCHRCGAVQRWNRDCTSSNDDDQADNEIDSPRNYKF